MDTSTQPTATNSVPSYPTPDTTNKKLGPIVAILVIVLVLIAAAIYLFATRGTTAEQIDSDNDTASSQEVQPVTNNSDEVSDLEADLDASVTGLDDQNF
jgi:hypothetical protein